MWAYTKRVYREWRQRRRSLRIERRSLADVIEGTEVRVVGLARPHGPVLESPLSGRLCVCYAIVIYDWHHDGSVRVLQTDQGRMPFALSDGAHRAVIDPGRAQMSALFDHRSNVRPHDREKLARLGIADRDWSRTRVLELDEAVIELDERIAVVGTAEREPDTDALSGGYRDGELPARVRIHPTLISDDPRLFV